jgi:hypothetical protein
MRTPPLGDLPTEMIAKHPHPQPKGPNVAEDEGLQELMEAASREHPGVMELLKVYGGFQEHLRMVAQYERLLRPTRSSAAANTSD